IRASASVAVDLSLWTRPEQQSALVELGGVDRRLGDGGRLKEWAIVEIEKVEKRVGVRITARERRQLEARVDEPSNARVIVDTVGDERRLGEWGYDGQRNAHPVTVEASGQKVGVLDNQAPLRLFRLEPEVVRRRRGRRRNMVERSTVLVIGQE